MSAGTPAPNILSTPVGYAFNAQGRQHVVYIGEDGNIYELWWG